MKFATTFAVAQLGITAGVKLVVVSNTNEVPSRADVYTVDTDSHDATKVADVDGSYVYVSGAAVCNNKYIAVATAAPIKWGLVNVDLSTGKSTPVINQAVLTHTMWCYNGADELLAWVSSPAPPFTLSTINATDGTVTGNVAGPFGATGAGGTDSIFQFDPSLGMAWAEFPKEGNVGGGTLVAVDVKTGNSTSYEIKRGFSPYAAWPTGPLKLGSEYGGLCAYSSDLSGKMYFCKNTLVKDGSKVVVEQKIGKDADDAYSSGQPLTSCGGKYYGIFQNSNLYELDPVANTVTTVMDLTSAIKLGAGQIAGGLACLQ